MVHIAQHAPSIISTASIMKRDSPPRVLPSEHVPFISGQRRQTGQCSDFIFATMTESSGSAGGPRESEALVKGWSRVLTRKQLVSQSMYRTFGRQRRICFTAGQLDISHLRGAACQLGGGLGGGGGLRGFQRFHMFHLIVLQHQQQTAEVIT